MNIIKYMISGVIIFILPGNICAQTISVTEFGAIPNDGKDDRIAIQKAIDKCKTLRADILLIPPGKYDIVDKDAVQLMNDIMSGKLGINPQDVVYTPYFPYSKGIDFSGMNKLHVIARGATLLCIGWMEPVSLEKCEDISIEGLTIDYKTIPHSEGEVV